LYGVANAFEWIINPPEALPTRQQELSLPPNITYEYAPISDLAPTTISDNPIAKFLEMTGRILLTPYILPLVIVAIILFAIIGLSFRKKKNNLFKTQQKQSNAWSKSL